MNENNSQEIGYAISITNYLVWVNGLPSVRLNEVVETEEQSKALVISIKNDLVGVLMLDESHIKPEQAFKRTQKQLSVQIGNHLLGRMINPLGQPLDGKGSIGSAGQEFEIEQTPPSIKSRETITSQFETGISLVDMLVPIAKGQRELIIGDPHSGKTGFIIDTIVNQKGKNTICVYGIIGKPLNEIRTVVKILSGNKATDYSIVIATSSSDKPPLIYLTPAIAITIAEYFQKRGNDVLLILDDMGVHAKFFREISLSLGKPPGRESYPGDIFYSQAKLIERAGKFNKEFGGGSITALPVIETNLDDFSAFLPTNLMGMTDGHLLFNSQFYHQGHRPAIDVSLSVSRVGHQTQNLVQKALADKIKTILAESRRLETYSRLGSEISPQTQFTLKQGRQIETIFKQLPLNKIPIPVQMILLGLVFTPFFTEKDVSFVENNKNAIISFLTTKVDLKSLLQNISKYKDEKQFIKEITAFIPGLEQVCKVTSQVANTPSKSTVRA